MKFLLVVHYFAPHIGGMEAVVLKQAESLSNMGHEVTIATCRPSKGAPLTEKLSDKITIKRFRSFNGIENKFGVTFPVISPTNLLWLLKAVGQHDVVHIHDVFYMSSHLAAFACWLKRKQFYLTQHVAVVDHPSKVVVGIQKTIYRLLGRPIFKRAQKIVAYNSNVYDFLLGEGINEEKVLLNYNGIDTDYFKPLQSAASKVALRRKYDIPADKPVALFVGRLVPKKGFDIVCDAADKTYTTLIVGGGIVPERMKQRSAVIFFGPTTSEQLRDLYRLADAFVFPAVGEMLTLVMQEAMASGLPVITTDEPAYRQYDLDRQKLKLVKRDSQSFRKAIKSVLKDSAARQAMASYSRKLALERFSWNKNYSREYAIYEVRS